jgi:hypothetical protein
MPRIDARAIPRVGVFRRYEHYSNDSNYGGKTGPERDIERLIGLEYWCYLKEKYHQYEAERSDRAYLPVIAASLPQSDTGYGLKKRYPRPEADSQHDYEQPREYGVSKQSQRNDAQQNEYMG